MLLNLQVKNIFYFLFFIFIFLLNLKSFYYCLNRYFVWNTNIHDSHFGFYFLFFIIIFSIIYFFYFYFYFFNFFLKKIGSITGTSFTSKNEIKKIQWKIIFKILASWLITFVAGGGVTLTLFYIMKAIFIKN